MPCRKGSCSRRPGELAITTRIYLFRHAKARFAEPGMRDFDRPLEQAGVEDAEAIGQAMLARGWLPDLVLCSAGKRARQTWEAAGRAMAAESVGETRHLDQLYDADAAGYLDIINGAGPAPSILVVGHNPMMEDLALALAKGNCGEAERIRTAGFPTAGLAVLEFATSVPELAPGTGDIIAFLTPRDL